MGKGQVNDDQNGHVGGWHVEAEAREVAAARGAERDGPLRVLLAITCSEEAADALPSWRW